MLSICPEIKRACHDHVNINVFLKTFCHYSATLHRASLYIASGGNWLTQQIINHEPFIACNTDVQSCLNKPFQTLSGYQYKWSEVNGAEVASASVIFFLSCVVGMPFVANNFIAPLSNLSAWRHLWLLMVLVLVVFLNMYTFLQVKHTAYSQSLPCCCTMPNFFQRAEFIHDSCAAKIHDRRHSAMSFLVPSPSLAH